jgi:putative transposase
MLVDMLAPERVGFAIPRSPPHVHFYFIRTRIRVMNRNFVMEAEDLNLAPQYVMRDNDTKFTAQLDAAIESSGARIKRNTPVSPKLRAHVERFIQSLKFEVLNKFVIVRERHLNHVNREWRLHCNREGPHEAQGHLTPALEKPPEANEAVRMNDVVYSSRLGALLKHYERRAA